MPRFTGRMGVRVRRVAGSRESLLSTSRTIAKNAGFLFLMRGTGFVLSFVLVMAIGRILGREGLGVYTLATAFLQVFVLIPNFGLDTLAIRDVARDRRRAGSYFAEMMGAKLALTLPACLLMLGAVELLHYPPETTTAIRLLCLALLADPLAEAAAAVYQGFERMEFMTMASGGMKIVVTGVSLALLARGAGVVDVLVVQVAGSFAVIPVHLLLLRRLSLRIPQRPSRAGMMTLLHEAYPLFLTNLVGLLYFRMDVVMLSKLRDEAEVGLYGAAYSVLRALVMIPSIFVTAIYPVLSRLYGNDGASLRRLCDTAFRYQLAVGLPLVAGLSTLAPETMHLVYGDDFAPSGPALRILIWTLFFFFTNTLLGYMLFTAGKQRSFLSIKLIALAVNGVANAILIPRYGIQGAAAATVGTTFVSFALHHRLVTQHLYRVNFPKILWRPVVASAVMALAVHLARDWPIGAVIPAGAALYAFVALVLLRILGPDDREILRTILRRGSTAPPPEGTP